MPPSVKSLLVILLPLLLVPFATLVFAGAVPVLLASVSWGTLVLEKLAEIHSEYDAIIIGGGGHGLATAYYLAKKHDMKNIAVVEKGWIGGGNTGRNTTIIRSNYLWNSKWYKVDFRCY